MEASEREAKAAGVDVEDLAKVTTDDSAAQETQIGTVECTVSDGSDVLDVVEKEGFSGDNMAVSAVDDGLDSVGPSIPEPDFEVEAATTDEAEPAGVVGGEEELNDLETAFAALHREMEDAVSSDQFELADELNEVRGCKSLVDCSDLPAAACESSISYSVFA